MDSRSLTPAETAELAAHARRASAARSEGMQLMRNRETGEHFATSKSHPGTLHRVTLLSCDCRGFARFQHCRHHSSLVMAHLLQELGTPDPDGVAPLAAEPVAAREDVIRTPGGRIIGMVKTTATTVEAWGYGPEHLALLVTVIPATGTDAQNRAADQVWQWFERTHWYGRQVA